MTSRKGYREIVALMAAYNEGDIIAHSIRRLVQQGIGVYLIDNWSTDDTLSQASAFAGAGLIGVEKFPAEGPSSVYDLHAILERKEALHSALGARFYVHHDVDEVRESPWPGVSLADGIRRVDADGYNCIDFLVIVFPPTDDAFVRGTDFEKHFRYYELGRNPGHQNQMKAWRNEGQKIDLASRAGHAVQFPGRRVYPTRFLLKHYPFRGQEHGRRKVLLERKARLAAEGRERGWHGHYDAVSSETCFVRHPSELLLYDEIEFKGKHLAAAAANAPCAPSTGPSGHAQAG